MTLAGLCGDFSARDSTGLPLGRVQVSARKPTARRSQLIAWPLGSLILLLSRGGAAAGDQQDRAADNAHTADNWSNGYVVLILFVNLEWPEFRDILFSRETGEPAPREKN